MALKFKYGAKDEIPAEQVSLYAEREGERVLGCDGVADRMLDELRSSNVALRKQVENLQTRYEGIDPDEARKLAGQTADRGGAAAAQMVGGSPPVLIS